MKHGIAVVIVLALAGCKDSSPPQPTAKAPPGPDAAAKSPPLLDPAARGPAPNMDPRAIDETIDKAQQFLLARQQPDATWKDAPGTDAGTASALISSALLKSGVRIWSDSPISNSLERLAKFKTDSTQVLGLRARAWRLASRQNHQAYLPLLREDVRRLVAATVSGGYGTTTTSKVADILSSRFGAMGVLAGEDGRLEIPRRYWTAILEYWLAAQNADGGWGDKTGGKSTPAMTAAGIAIVQGCIKTEITAVRMGRPSRPAAEALARAQAWLDANFAEALQAETDLPHLLYEVELASRHTGRRRLGRIDWQREGASKLVATQKPDGSWNGPLGPEVTTAHALMFLLGTRAQITFLLLRHGGDWNNWPHAMGALREYAARDGCKPQMDWRLVDVQTPQAIVRETPILVVKGADAPNFTPGELSFMRTHALAGGLVWTIAEGPAFDKGMREVYKKLFPTRRLKPCPPEHPVRNMLYKLGRRPELLAVSNGARTLAVHCTEDLAKPWHLQMYATRRHAFETAQNLVCFATDILRNVRRPGETPWPGPFKGKPKLTITLARLKYEGNYDPEPLAYERFKRMMGHLTATRVDVVGPVDIVKLAAAKAKLAVLTGTTAFTLTPAEQQALKRFIAGGGTLFIDAAGGDAAGVGFRIEDDTGRYAGMNTPKGFTLSVEETLTDMFPKRKLTRLKADSPIYTISPEPIKSARWRHVTRFRMLGSKRPELRAVVIDGRPAVIFSRLDVTAGLLGATAYGIDGYAPRSAYAIMRNIVWYAAKDRPNGDKAK